MSSIPIDSKTLYKPRASAVFFVLKDSWGECKGSAQQTHILQTDVDPLLGHILLGFWDCVLTKMEDAGR
jgi:hypothetical protein